MWLHGRRVFRLAEYFEEVIVRNEIESREYLSLCFQVHIEGLLNVLESCVHVIQLLIQAFRHI